MTLSIIMVNYNAPRLTEQAIESVFCTRPEVTYEIILVENGNELVSKYEGVKQIKSFHIKNSGFGHACNFGARQAAGEYLLFLNNDTVMQPHTLDKSVGYLRKRPEIGIMGVRITLPDGALDHGCKRGFPTPFAAFCYFSKLDKLFPHSARCGAYRQTTIKESDISRVDAVSGAYLMIPRKLFIQIGGFDEQFFMYGEDIDLCYRVKQKGFEVIYFGEASITHLKGQSGLRSGSRAVVAAFYEAMTIFYRKHYFEKYPWIVSMLVLTAIKMKRGIALRAVRSW